MKVKYINVERIGTLGLIKIIFHTLVFLLPTLFVEIFADDFYRVFLIILPLWWLTLTIREQSIEEYILPMATSSTRVSLELDKKGRPKGVLRGWRCSIKSEDSVILDWCNRRIFMPQSIHDRLAETGEVIH